MTLPRRILSLSLLLVTAASGLRADTLNRLVLRINDQIATLYDYQQRREDALRDIMNRVQDPTQRRQMLDQLPLLVFRDMYEQLLLESRADQLGIEVTDHEIDEAIASLRQEYGIENEEQFEAALHQSGMTLELLRKQMRTNLRLQQVRGREVRPRVQLDEEDLRRYYAKNRDRFRTPEQIHVQEIVVREDSGAPADERQRVATEIRQQVNGGVSLADAVAPFSAKGQTTNVVDLGWMSKGDLDPTLEAAAWNLAPGAVSIPIEGRGGLHVVQVTERRPSRVPDFVEVVDQIRESESNRVYNEEITKYMAELEKKSLIVANPPAEAADFRRLLGRPPGPEAGGLAGAVAAPGSEGAETMSTPPPSQGQASAPDQPQAPGTLPEPKPTTDTPPPVAPPPGR